MIASNEKTQNLTSDGKSRTPLELTGILDEKDINSKIEKIMNSVEKSSHGTFDCTFCPFKTKNSKHDLKSHIINHFPRENISNFYKCKYCDYYLMTVTSINKHERLHNGLTPNGNEKKDNSVNLPIKKNDFTCKRCPYVSNYSDNLVKHEKNHTFKTGNNFDDMK